MWRTVLHWIKWTKRFWRLSRSRICLICTVYITYSICSSCPQKCFVRGHCLFTGASPSLAADWAPVWICYHEESRPGKPYCSALFWPSVLWFATRIPVWMFVSQWSTRVYWGSSGGDAYGTTGSRLEQWLHTERMGNNKHRWEWVVSWLEGWGF